MNKLPPESEVGAFIDFLPEEMPSPILRQRVKSWMKERKWTIRKRDEYIILQLGLSFVAVFFYRIPLSSGPVHCLSLQAYGLGR